jgi:type II secretory pathway pseudopilin PulG
MTAAHRLGIRRRSGGFTLLEMAVVLLVVVLLLGSLLVPLSTQVDQRNIAVTERRLEDIRDAIMGFVLTNGRLPCPASATSNGLESFCTNATGACGAPTTAVQTHGTCTNFLDGFVPAVTLGLNQVDGDGYAVDAFELEGNRIRYAVTGAKILPVPPPNCEHTFTCSPDGIKSAGLMGLSASSAHLYVCATSSGISGTDCGSAQPLSNGDAVFVIYSLGKNPTDPASPDETANANNDKVFVSKAYSNRAGAQFDDQLLWVSRFTVIMQMVDAKLLP